MPKTTVSPRQDPVSVAASTRDTSKRKRRETQAARLSSLKVQLLSTASLPDKLKLITDDVVETFGADFARIWVVREADLCEHGCQHAAVTEGPHVCRDRSCCLHLMASSGRYTHIDGGHRTVPLGCYKIGWVATGDDAKFINNDMTHDPRVHNHQWASELGLVSFAGFRLLSPEGRPIGVLALFSKQVIAPSEGLLLEDLANTASHVIVAGLAIEALTEARERAEKALSSSENDYQNLVEYMNDWVWEVDENAVYTFVSPNAHDLLGYKPEEIIGKTPFDLMGPEEAERVAAILGHIAARREPFAFLENTVLRKDGHSVTVETSGTPVFGEHGEFRGYRGVDRDITERKQAEEALRESESRMRVITDSAQDAILMMDPEGRVSYWNPAAEHILGYTSAEAIGQSLHSFIAPPRYYEAHQAAFPAFQQTGQGSAVGKMVDLEARRKDGKEISVELSLSAIQMNNGWHAVGILRDITERKRAEENKQKMEIQLRHAQKLESIGQLAAGIAHEINTPTQYVGDNTCFLRDSFQDLARLMGKYAELSAAATAGNIPAGLLEETEAVAKEVDVSYLASEIPAAIDESLTGIARIAEIVRAMKEFSHPGAEDKTPVDINKAIETTVTVARNEWKYVAEVELDLDPDLPHVSCFPGDFNQVILNMVVNAAHAIADVAGDGSASKGTITIGTRHDSGWVEIRISDTGSGIPEDVKSRIFDPFFTTKEVGKGTGQGLAIAHTVITDKHSGDITFETEVGKGTTFLIRIPTGQCAADLEAA